MYPTRELNPAQAIAGLRAWAQGSYPLEAAVELLARTQQGRFADPAQPWIATSAGAPVRAWLEAGVLADAAAFGPYSGGERRLLAIAAGLAGAGTVELDEVIPGLDRHLLALVLAALAHAGGSHEHPLMRPHPALGGALFPTRERAGSLHPWPTHDPDHDPDHDPEAGRGEPGTATAGGAW